MNVDSELAGWRLCCYAIETWGGGVDALRSLVETWRQRHAIAGVAAAILRLDTDPTIVCSGLADVASGRPVTPETVFRIASVTKTLTAIGIMQLREAGCFGLDEPVNDHLKSFRVETPADWPRMGPRCRRP